MNQTKTKQMILAAMMLALAYVLPFFTGNIPQIGSMLLPMHLPTLLCGFLCGGGWGAAVGFCAPLLRSLIIGMPPMMAAIAMAFEMAVYGLIAGILYRKLAKNLVGIYTSLITAMVAGRLVWGLVRYLLTFATETEFPFSAFLAGAVTSAVPGIILQLVLIPVIVVAAQNYQNKHKE